jgi:HSP20 family protein
MNVGVNMIIVNLKPNPLRTSAFIPDDPTSLISGIVNWRLTVQPNVWSPPTDVFETGESFVVRVEIAGMREADFSVTLDKQVLTISGIRPEFPERKAFYQMEIHFGEFVTEIEIPSQVDPDRVEAFYQDGFLRVNLPKA